MWDLFKYDKNSRIFINPETNEFQFRGGINEENVAVGGGQYAPYEWDPVNNKVRYADKEFQFFPTGGFMVLKTFGSPNTLIDDQRWEIQVFRDPPGQWRILDLYNSDIVGVNEYEDRIEIQWRMWDEPGSGNEFNATYIFHRRQPVQLLLHLEVANANTYRIRFQNSGIAGEMTEVHDIEIIDGEQPIDHGVEELLFDNMFFKWTREEIEGRNYIVEQQAQGKKVDIYMGDYDLPDDGEITITPDTFGYTSIATGADDALQQGGGSPVSSTTTNLWLKTDTAGQSSTTYRSIALRWDNVTIPQGALISEAIMQLIVDTVNTGDWEAIIQADDTDDAVDFATQDIYTRTPTTAGVFDDQTVIAIGDTLTTTDFDIVVQEIVNRVGWVSGNAIVIICFASDATDNHDSKYASYEHATYDPAQIRITYAASAAELAGITKDNDGNVLGSCECFLVKRTATDTMVFVDYLVSHATTGAYLFEDIVDTDAEYLVIAWKDGTPNVMDATDYVLQPVEP